MLRSTPASPGCHRPHWQGRPGFARQDELDRQEQDGRQRAQL